MEVYWHTVQYRTVALYVLLVLTILATLTYIVFPQMSASLIRRISDAVGPQNGGVATITARQARFVNLDGKVQVKKVNSVQWMTADYQLTLDKGDLIQTDSEGVARIAFADGTTYTVKGDCTGTGTFQDGVGNTFHENLVVMNGGNQIAVVVTDPGSVIALVEIRE